MQSFIRWHDDTQSVLYLEIAPGWSWEEVYDLAEQVTRLRQTGDHLAGYLVYAPGTNEFPPGLSVTRMKRLLTLEDEEQFLMVVGTSLFIQMMITSIMSLLGVEQRRRVHFASTLEEALPMMAALRSQAQAAQVACRPAHSA